MEGLISTIIETTGTLIVAFGSIYLNNKITKKNKKGEDLNEDYIRKNKVYPILEELKYSLEASRVQEWAFSNGDTTFAGQHLKKMSILLEVNDEKYENIGHYFQLVPTKKFERNLDALYESDSQYIISKESSYSDELSSLYSQFDIKTVLMVKIVNNFGKWIGILAIMYDSEKVIENGEIALAKLIASRIGGIK